MKKTLIALPLVGLLPTVVLSCFVFRFHDCPDNNHVALEQYNNNKPVLSRQFVVDDDQRAVANALVSLWLNWFTSREADAGIKLRKYNVQNIDVGQWKGDGFLALVTFSVKPEKCSYEEWVTGNGEEARDWVRHKTLFFSIIKEGENYRVQSVGSSP